MRSRRDIFVFLGFGATVVAVSAAFAFFAMDSFTQHIAVSKNPKLLGMPTDWQLNFHLPNSAFQDGLDGFHNLLLGVDIGICGLVVFLVAFAIWRFRESQNPVPSTRSHNTPLEIAWTLIPSLILIIIAIPSFRLLYDYNHFPKTATILRVTGHQWYWEYQYPGYKNIDIQSLILTDDQLKGPQRHNRLLLVDNYAMLPVDTDVLIEVTSGDVIHSFFVASLGLQKYAVPGRINKIWTRIDREGTFYGQCNQLCGVNHAFMPIGIKVVSRQAFAEWLKAQQQKQTSALVPPKRLAVLSPSRHTRGQS